MNYEAWWVHDDTSARASHIIFHLPGRCRVPINAPAPRYTIRSNSSALICTVDRLHSLQSLCPTSAPTEYLQQEEAPEQYILCIKVTWWRMASTYRQLALRALTACSTPGPGASLSWAAPLRWCWNLGGVLSPSLLSRQLSSRTTLATTVVEDSCDTPSDIRKFETLVGLELHVQINSRTKLFSSAPTSVGGQPNSHVSVFDAGLPGTLPVINRACVEAAVLTGIAVGGTIHQLSSFDRKHYFYPDLPHGFQITQMREPIVTGGALDVTVGDAVKRVEIQRIQLEVDTGKSTHDLDPTSSFIDLNRAGSALMEVVTGPDLASGEEAAAFVRTFQQLLRHVGSSDGNLEDGSLRVDVNISVKDGSRTSNRVEVKNLNSTKSIARAVDHESRRHAEALLAGGDVQKETRSFDARGGTTVPLRSKEAGLDYRFLVEPDLPPLLLIDEDLEKLRASVPELPAATSARLQRLYGLQASQAKHFTREPAQRRLLEDIMASSWGTQLEGRTVANIVQGDVLRCSKERKLSIGTLPASASAERLAQLMVMLRTGKLSRGLGKPAILALVSGDSRGLDTVVSSLSGADSGILEDPEELRSLCQQILKEQSKEVEQFRNGNARKMMSFVGALMKRTKGRADPKAATAIFHEIIEGGVN